MKRRLFTLLMFVTVLSLLAACGGQAATEAPKAEPTKAPMADATKPPMAEPTKAEEPAMDTPFKAGLLAPGPVNDGGWNQTAYNAFKKMEAELGAEISYVETEQSPAAFEKAFRDYASQGYQFILGHGNEYTDAALAVAPDYPDTFFFLSSSRQWDPKIPNVVGLNTDISNCTYLMGYVGAKMGTGGAGLIGGMEIPPIAEAFTGFKNGAEMANPDFPVKVTYLGNWTDTAAAKEAAISYVDGGADVLLGNADFATQGVFQAMDEKNVMGFSIFGENFDKAPNILMAGLVDYGEGLLEMASQVKDGTFKPTSNVEFGVKDEKVMWLVYNDKAATPVPADLRAEVDGILAKIKSGEIITLAP